MKTILIVWGLALVYCIFEGIFFSELDPESKEILNKRNKLRNEGAKKE